MSLKDNVNLVKEELSSEEKFLESSVKLERFYKKYKVLIIAAVVVLVGGTIAFYTTNSIKEAKKLEANIAFNKVLENPKDAQALATLKDKNLQLFQVANYINDIKESKLPDTQVAYLKELVEYQKALNEKNANKLNAVSMQNDFLLKEFAIFNKALLEATEGKYEDAKATLKLIPQDSKAIDLVNVLNHYLVTK